MGARLAIVASSLVLAVCLAIAPLYVSSAGTRAVQVALERRCGADAGLQLRPRLPADAAGMGARLAGLERASALARRVAHVSPTVVTAVTEALSLGLPGGAQAPRRMIVLMHRPDQGAHLSPPSAEPAGDEVVLPAWVTASLGLEDGDSIVVGGSDWQRTLAVHGAYEPIPVRPVASYWCTQRQWFTPTPAGDPPIPVGFVSSSLMQQLQRTGSVTLQWEARPDADGLTRSEAHRLRGELDRVLAGYEAASGGPSALDRRFRVVTPGEIGFMAARADEAATFVARAVAPVRLVAAAAAAVVLVAAGLLVGRRRRAELTILTLRGAPPARLAVSVARAVAVPAAGGSGLGLAVALLVCRTAGPAPQLEPTALHAAVVAALGSWLAAVAVITVSAVSTTAAIDPARRRRWRLAAVPWELATVMLAVMAYARLGSAGAVQLVGGKASGGDPLGQAFPVLVALAVVAVGSRPLHAALRRHRLGGRRLGYGLRLGVRRVAMDPAVTVGVLAAVCLAAASFATATVLTDSADRLLADKARTYVGTDLTVTTTVVPAQLPAAYAARSTVVVRAGGRSGDQLVDVLGVDPATFAGAAFWRRDFAERPLARVLSAIAHPPPGQLAAVAVGRPLPTPHVEAFNRQAIDVEVVGTADAFPSFQNGATLLVVDRDALLASGLTASTQVWVRGGTAADAQALGVPVIATQAASEVFDVTSFLAVRWSYGALKGFGLLVGAIALAMQLLVLDARSRTRQLAYLVSARMGIGRRTHGVALLIELALPLATGVAAGLLSAITAARLGVVRLDNLRSLRPTASPVVRAGGFVPVLLAALASLVALCAAGQLSTRRAKANEVLRATV